jgi:cytochrome c-type biogenesis protein CcmH/NrfF
MDDVNMADVTMKMYEDTIKDTQANLKLRLLIEIHELEKAGKSKEEILDTIIAELKK